MPKNNYAGLVSFHANPEIMKIKSIIAIFILVAGFTACDVVRQAGEMTRLTKCEFRLYTIEDIHIAGIDVQEVKSLEEMSVFEVVKLTSALAGGSLPLDFKLNIQAKNPNSGVAAMNKLDWILFIDDIEMTRGVVEERFEIPPNGVVNTLPLQLSIDLLDVLTRDTVEALANFAFNLAGSGNKPTRIMLQAKPTIYVGNQAIEYPGYLKIKTEFTSSM